MPKTRPQQFNVRKVADWLIERQSEMVSTVREMVVRESPTNNKAACDALCAHLADQFGRAGGKIKIHRQRKAGDHLQINFAGPATAASGSVLGSLRYGL